MYSINSSYFSSTSLYTGTERCFNEFFIKSMANMLRLFSLDILSIYRFFGEGQMLISNVFSKEFEDVAGSLMSMEDYVIKCMIYEEFYVYKYKVGNLQVLSLSEQVGKISPSDYYLIKTNLPTNFKDLLVPAFKILYKNYCGIINDLGMMNKVIFGKKDFNSSIASADVKKMNAIIENVQKQISEFDKSKTYLNDADDTIAPLVFDFNARTASIQFAYDEIARIFQIPKSKLFGDSPSGFNSSGSYEKSVYEERLNSFRLANIDPFIQIAKLNGVVKVVDFNSQKVNNIINILTRLNIQMTDEQKDQLVIGMFT